MKSETLTPTQAARESGVFVNYLYLLLASGKLRGERIDGKWRIARADFERWRKTHCFRKGKGVTEPEPKAATTQTSRRFY